MYFLSPKPRPSIPTSLKYENQTQFPVNFHSHWHPGHFSPPLVLPQSLHFLNLFLSTRESPPKHTGQWHTRH